MQNQETYECSRWCKVVAFWMLVAGFVIGAGGERCMSQRPAVVAQNLSPDAQTAWVFVGHPGSPTLSGAVAMPGGFAARLSLKGAETRRYAFGDTAGETGGDFSS